MRNDLLDREAALRLLEPHTDGIRAAIEGGWNDWHATVSASPITTPLRKTTRANLVYDYITGRAEAYFDGVGVRTTRKRHYLAVAFEDAQVVLRFKKFKDRALHTSGIETMHRRAVEGQQMTLDGLAVTYLVAGYLPDDEGIDLQRVSVVCSYYNEVLWEIPLDATMSTSAPTPLTQEDAEAPEVRSTRPAAQKAETEGS